VTASVIYRSSCDGGASATPALDNRRPKLYSSGLAE
jgi:hypothetical protein